MKETFSKIGIFFGCVCFIIMLLSVIFWIIYPICANNNDHEIIMTVTDKEFDSRNNKYLLFGTLENGETKVVCIKDTLIRGRWNGSDVYQQINVNTKYHFGCVGYRIPFLSEYENVLTYEVLETYIE